MARTPGSSPNRGQQTRSLFEVAKKIRAGLAAVFERGANARWAVFSPAENFHTDPRWREGVPFDASVDGDSGTGIATNAGGAVLVEPAPVEPLRDGQEGFPPMPLANKPGAAFLGTPWLVFGGCSSALLAAAFPDIGIGPTGVSLAFGLTVVTMAYAVGHISGGHFDPAVTLGLWAGAGSRRRRMFSQSAVGARHGRETRRPGPELRPGPSAAVALVGVPSPNASTSRTRRTVARSLFFRFRVDWRFMTRGFAVIALDVSRLLQVDKARMGGRDLLASGGRT